MSLLNLNRRLSKNTSYVSKSRRGKTRWIKGLFVLVFLFMTIYLPIRGIYSSVRQITKNIKQMSQSAKQNNLDGIKSSVVNTKSALGSLNNSLNFLFWVRAVPFINGYYLDAKHFASAADYELNAVQILIDSLYPYKGELGLTGQATPGQDRVAQVVKILDKILPDLDKVEPDLKKAAIEVASIDTSKYPATYGNRQLRLQIETAKNFILGASSVVSENRPLLEVVPQALGESEPKSYLLLFQNDKELRPTGGFLTAYAFLKIDKGHLSTSVSDDIYRLDEKLLNVCLHKICPLSPPAPLVKYLPEADGRLRTSWSMRDSNLSPDLPTSLKDFERMYQLLGDVQDFDGIITIDTKVVEDLIRVTGMMEIDGTRYSAENDKRCNCPNVVYELERYSQVIERGEASRKAILGVLMQQLLARSLGASTEKLPEFINTGATLANQKHVMFYMHDQKVQAALSKLNWTGEIKSTTGDYLHINDANFAGGKSNLYVQEQVTLEVNGNIHKLTLEYKNPQPFSVWLNGINRDYIRIYVPKGSSLVNSKGSDEKVNTLDDEELGKIYFEAFITVRPGNSRTLSFEYTTSVSVNDKNYQLLIQKQPGSKDHHYNVKLNGKRSEFNLTEDKSLSN